MNPDPSPAPPIYHPINCDLYDELVLMAMGRRPCQIHYRNPQGQDIQITEVILDIVSRAGREFLILAQGDEISLDTLLQVNGLDFQT